MSKKQKFQRSDIPYAQRLQMRKEAEIYTQREDAARTAMKIACVALNDTEGLGFIRLARFGARFNELVSEFYNDREVSEYHLNERLEQLGFRIGTRGEVFAVQKNDGSFVKTAEISKEDLERMEKEAAR